MMTIDIADLSLRTWQSFYKMQAGLMTEREFIDFASRENKVPVNVLHEQKLIEMMRKASNPLLTQSVQYYYCTGMRDRGKSLQLLTKAAELGDALAANILDSREGKW